MFSAITISVGEGTVRPFSSEVSENEFRVALEEFQNLLSDSAITTLTPETQGIWSEHLREEDF